MNVSRRASLKGIAVLAVADKLTDGGFASVSLPGVPKRTRPVLPPGARSRAEFAKKCIACGLCSAACPEKILKPSTAFATFGQPELDFRGGYCLTGCVRCSQVCPAGALESLQVEMRQNLHLGKAVWHRDRCLRETEKESCEACVRKCPVRAIHLVKGFPVVDEAVCIGCGACEHVCPARPLPAIAVDGNEEQRKVVPMSEEDLISEMRALVRSGKAAAVARNGIIALQLEGSGVRPIYEALAADFRAFAGAVVVDKVVGRAAASIYVVGKARKVFAEVMSDGARDFLTAHGVVADAAKFTGEIVNREGSGACPMEAAVKKLTDPEKMVEAIGKELKK